MRERNEARTKHARHRIHAVHDRGLEPDLAVAAIEDNAERVPELLAHVFDARRADPAIAIGRWRRDAAAEGAEQLLRDRVARHAHGHRVLSAGDGEIHRGGATQHQRQGAGPETIRQRPCCRRNAERPAVQHPRMIDVHDERMRGRPALQLEDLADGIRVLRVGAEPVDGLGRKGDDLALAQRFDCAVDLFLGQPGGNHP